MHCELFVWLEWPLSKRNGKNRWTDIMKDAFSSISNNFDFLYESPMFIKWFVSVAPIWLANSPIQIQHAEFTAVSTSQHRCRQKKPRLSIARMQCQLTYLWAAMRNTSMSNANSFNVMDTVLWQDSISQADTTFVASGLQQSMKGAVQCRRYWLASTGNNLI